MGKRRGAYRVFVRKPEEMSNLEDLEFWEDNMKMNLPEIA
jgi:hypothetical protein